MPRDNSRAKLYSNCKLCAGRFWCFLRDKGHKRKTLIKYKQMIKIEYSRGIRLQGIMPTLIFD